MEISKDNFEIFVYIGKHGDTLFFSHVLHEVTFPLNKIRHVYSAMIFQRIIQSYNTECVVFTQDLTLLNKLRISIVRHTKATTSYRYNKAVIAKIYNKFIKEQLNINEKEIRFYITYIIHSPKDAIEIKKAPIGIDCIVKLSTARYVDIEHYNIFDDINEYLYLKEIDYLS